jgi:hypothetical protein
MLTKIYLPWVPELKGSDGNERGGRELPLFLASVKVKTGAYRLVSTAVVVISSAPRISRQGRSGRQD